MRGRPRSPTVRKKKKKESECTYSRAVATAAALEESVLELWVYGEAVARGESQLHETVRGHLHAVLALPMLMRRLNHQWPKSFTAATAIVVAVTVCVAAVVHAHATITADRGERCPRRPIVVVVFMGKVHVAAG